MFLEYRVQSTEYREQRTENRVQRTEYREQRDLTPYTLCQGVTTDESIGVSSVVILSTHIRTGSRHHRARCSCTAHRHHQRARLVISDGCHAVTV